MDAPRDFLKKNFFYFLFLFFIFSPNEQRARGGGVRCQTFSFSFFPCSADHERDWPPCKVVFFGLATNALNVKNNNNNNNNNGGWVKREALINWSMVMQRQHPPLEPP